jgi:hypothetical protein
LVNVIIEVYFRSPAVEKTLIGFRGAEVKRSAGNANASLKKKQ